MKSEYVHRLKNFSSLSTVNSTNTLVFAQTKPENIKLWNARMVHLGLEDLTALKNINSKIKF